MSLNRAKLPCLCPVTETYASGCSARTVASGYFAKRWLFVWWQDRFPDDESWFKERLSRPEQVKVDQTDTLRFHVATAADLDVLKAALKDAEARNSTA